MPTFSLELWRVAELTEGNIGLGEYPIFDESYREGLNKKIFEHYHDREIEGETIKRWQFFMRRRMNEIMPLYNQLYTSTQIEFDPLSTVDIRTVTLGTGESDTTSTAESSQTAATNSGSCAVTSVLPQVRLSGDADYATSAVDTTGQSTSSGGGAESGNVKATTKNDSESRTTGYQGHASELIREYRASLMNIDLMVIDELSDLFVNVWNSGDNYKPDNPYMQILPNHL